MTEPTLLPGDLHLFESPPGRLRMTAGDRSWPTIVPVWPAPLSQPSKFLCLLDGKGSEIVMIEELSDLSEESRSVVEGELRRRYLTSRIEKVVHAKVEFGATYWTVITERGERDFVTQSLQENAQWLGPRHLLLVDVDGNRFEIPDVAGLDPTSKRYVESIL